MSWPRPMRNPGYSSSRRMYTRPPPSPATMRPSSAHAQQYAVPSQWNVAIRRPVSRCHTFSVLSPNAEIARSFAIGAVTFMIPDHHAWQCGLHCGRESTMEIIQVVLDTKLLKAADLAAKRHKVNRSALIRQALEQHLKRLRALELEEQDRRGYLAHPQREEEARIWEDAAAWPEL